MLMDVDEAASSRIRPGQIVRGTPHRPMELRMRDKQYGKPNRSMQYPPGKRNFPILRQFGHTAEIDYRIDGYCLPPVDDQSGIDVPRI